MFLKLQKKVKLSPEQNIVCVVQSSDASKKISKFRGRNSECIQNSLTIITRFCYHTLAQSLKLWTFPLI